MEFRWFSIQVTYHSQKEANEYRLTMQSKLDEMSEAIASGFTVQFAVPNGDYVHVYLTRKIGAVS